MKHLRKFNESMESNYLYNDIKEILSSGFIDCGFNVDIEINRSDQLIRILIQSEKREPFLLNQEMVDEIIRVIYFMKENGWWCVSHYGSWHSHQKEFYAHDDERELRNSDIIGWKKWYQINHINLQFKKNETS